MKMQVKDKTRSKKASVLQAVRTRRRIRELRAIGWTTEEAKSIASDMRNAPDGTPLPVRPKDLDDPVDPGSTSQEDEFIDRFRKRRAQAHLDWASEWCSEHQRHQCPHHERKEEPSQRIDRFWKVMV